MSLTTPLVTVVIKKYEDLDFVIQQLKGQTLQPYEIILDSDLCFSLAGEKLKKHLAKVFPDANVDLSTIYSPQGAYVFIMTPQTALHPKCLEVLAGLLEQNEDASFASCLPMVYDDDPRHWVRMRDAWEVEADFYSGEQVAEAIATRRFTNGIVLYRRREWHTESFRVYTLAAERGFCYTPQALLARPRSQVHTFFSNREVLKHSIKEYAFDSGLGPLNVSGLLSHARDGFRLQFGDIEDLGPLHYQYLQNGFHAQVAQDLHGLRQAEQRFRQQCGPSGIVQEALAWARRLQLSKLGLCGLDALCEAVEEAWPAGPCTLQRLSGDDFGAVQGVLMCHPPTTSAHSDRPTFTIPQEVLW